MDHSTHSKTDNVAEDKKFRALNVLAKVFGEKLRSKGLVIQHAGHIGMPVNIDGKQLGNINFVMLAAPIEQDPRWATFADIQISGHLLAKNALSSLGAFSVPVERNSAAGESQEIVGRGLALLHLYNGSKIVTNEGSAMGLPMHNPKIAKEDAVEAALSQAASNAGLLINTPVAGRDIADGKNLHVNMNVSNSDRLGEVAFAFSRWARSDLNLSRPMDESPARQLLVEAMATAMICAETGARYPQSLADKVNARIADITKLVNDDPADFARMGREAWQVKEFIAQFVSADENSIEASAAGEANTFRQDAKSIFGR